MARLTGKTALITGGTTGIGMATAVLFVDKGAKVLITGQDRARVQQAVERPGAATTGICADQTSLSDLAALAEQVKENFGQLDILFLNAGVTMPAATSDESESHFDTQVAINLKGPINTPLYGKLGFSPAALQQMAASTQAKIPMGRFGNPDEIAKAVLFLASDDSSFVLGEEVVVDGGWAAL